MLTSPKFISVESLSGVPGLMYEEDEPYRVYLDPGVMNELLGHTLLMAFDKSRFVDNSEPEFFDPNRATRAYENWEKDVVQRYGFKSKRDAYKSGVGANSSTERLRLSRTAAAHRVGGAFHRRRRSSFRRPTTPRQSEQRCASP